VFAMRLWTIQPLKFYERLLTECVIHCDPVLSDYLRENSDFSFRKEYDWLAYQMQKRIGTPPAGVKYPIWAWYSLRGKHQKPDLRRTECRNYTGHQTCLEIEIPDKDVLLSDEVSWYIVLNDGYYASSKDDDGIEAEYAWYEHLPEDIRREVQVASWERIFDVLNLSEPSQFIQATFWELRLEQIIAVRHFKGRLGQTVT
jgi:hypothetical protein